MLITTFFIPLFGYFRTSQFNIKKMFVLSKLKNDQKIVLVDSFSDIFYSEHHLSSNNEQCYYLSINTLLH